jgi:hypothetical protein
MAENNATDTNTSWRGLLLSDVSEEMGDAEIDAGKRITFVMRPLSNRLVKNPTHDRVFPATTKVQSRFRVSRNTSTGRAFPPAQPDCEITPERAGDAV